MEAEYNDRKVVFFDGLCGLCNGFVDFVMKHDKAQTFQFSPLQSEFARKTLPSEFTQDLKSVVVKLEGKTYKKTDAVIKVLNSLGGIWSVASILKMFPRSLLDLAYDIVANNRYKLFGKKDTCRLPTPEERQRFIL